MHVDCLRLGTLLVAIGRHLQSPRRIWKSMAKNFSPTATRVGFRAHAGVAARPKRLLVEGLQVHRGAERWQWRSDSRIGPNMQRSIETWRREVRRRWCI